MFPDAPLILMAMYLLLLLTPMISVLLCPPPLLQCRPVQALITRLCKDASAAAAEQQHQLPPNAPRPQLLGLGASRGDVLLLARLLDVLHTANVQVGVSGFAWLTHWFAPAAYTCSKQPCFNAL